MPTQDAENAEAMQRLRHAGKGARVVTTPLAIERNIERRERHGVIVGWGLSRLTVRVLRDGTTEPLSYHGTFWEPTERSPKR